MVRYPLVCRHCQMYTGARWTWVRTSHQLVYHLRLTARRQRASSANGIFPSYKEEEGFTHIHNNNFETRTNLQGAFQEQICSCHFRLLSDQNPGSLVWPARLFHFYCPRRCGLTDSAGSANCWRSSRQPCLLQDLDMRSSLSLVILIAYCPLSLGP